MLASLMLVGFAMAQEPVGACNVTFEVVCQDCMPDEDFAAEIYQFNHEGVRMQARYLPHMKSGESISTGNMTPGRRTLVIEDAEFATVGCVNDEDVHYQVKILLHEEDTESDDPFGIDDLDDDPPVEAESPVYHPPSDPPAPDPEPAALPTLTTSAPPPPPVAFVPDPPARVVVDEEPVDTAVVPRVVGWAAPGGDPVWTGNAGDYPSSPVANRRGKFAGAGVSRCPAGKLPAVLGTADHISGGRPAQDALDDARARDVAPADWEGAYAIALRTAILGDQAAAVWCINPGDLNPTSAEGRQMVADAAPPPLPMGDLVVEQITGPVNLPAGGEAMFSATLRNTGNAPVAASAVRFAVDGITLADVAVPPLTPGEDATVQSPIWTANTAGLHTPRATADVNNVVPEANEWDNSRDSVLDVAAPPTAAAPVEPAAPFVLRKGGFIAFQYSTTFGENNVAYPHVVAGGFVTFNLIPKSGRLGLEPYIGAGTDAESSHPCGVAEDGSVAMCSGWYLSTTAGVRLPVAVIKKDKFQLLVFPDLGLVSDDITVGFTSWADLVSFQVGVELWLTGKVPFAVSLETGATRLSFLNDNQLHTNGWAWPIRLDVKMAFK